MRTKLLPFLLVVFLYDSCSLSSCDHPTNAAARRELVEVAGSRIALGQIYVQGDAQPTLRLKFFDGREETRPLTCCANSAGSTISQNRIVLVDISLRMTQSPWEMMRTTQNGGQVAVLDLDGKVIGRSKVRISSGLVALSPDGRRFAFGGTPGGFPLKAQGVYIASFDSTECRRVFPVVDQPPGEPHTLGRDYSLQWSPDGGALLYSYRGKVVLIDLRTGQTRSLVDGGGAARLSPRGDRLAYITPNTRVALLDLTSGQSHLIDPDRGTNMRPVEWSPDGRYVTFVETEGSHVPYGCLWVYRVSDGAFVAIPDWGIGPSVHWVALGNL